MSTTRRGFLAGILAAGFAPAAIGSGVLMPVRRLTNVAPRLVTSRIYQFNGTQITRTQFRFDTLWSPQEIECLDVMARDLADTLLGLTSLPASSYSRGH